MVPRVRGIQALVCEALRLFCLLPALLIVTSACGKDAVQSPAPLQFWHTLNSNESAALDAWLARSDQPPVATTILPFARATSRFRSAMKDGRCPDLLRIDATRIPTLVESESVHEVPAKTWQKQRWLPEAASLVEFGGKNFGLPQSLDGLALVRRRSETSPWTTTSFDAWIESARSAKRQPSVGILLDGYWFVAFLRSQGSDLPGEDGLPPANSPQAEAALQSFANTFQSGLAMDLLEERAPARAMIKAFRRGELTQVLTGPWNLVELAEGQLESLEVRAFPGGAAPRGGQVLVVPRCAKDPKAAWALASALTAPELQSRWAMQLSSIPTTELGLQGAGPLVSEFYQALQNSRPLPRHARVPELFDDLTPAVIAVVSGDASAAEALAGVNRSWNRLYGIEEAIDEP